MEQKAMSVSWTVTEQGLEQLKQALAEGQKMMADWQSKLVKQNTLPMPE